MREACRDKNGMPFHFDGKEVAVKCLYGIL